MRLSISNIAWEPAEDTAVAALLQARGVDAIDVAPGKYFADVTAATAADIATVRQQWAAHGITLWGMQALLYGTSGLNVFGDANVQAHLLQHLDHVFRIAAGLGIRRLTFGSPKARNRTGLSDAQAFAVGAKFFARLATAAAAHEVCLCLEPNPAASGCNFLTDSDSTLALVRSIDHPNLRMQLDSGALTMNAEEPEAVIAAAAPYIGHVHISEPHLAVLGECTGDGCNHAAVAKALRAHLPAAVLTIEMLVKDAGSHLPAIGRALSVAQKYYGAAAAPAALRQSVDAAPAWAQTPL
jgi:D-psicose/D-tagatose/L-ribulose 3-epimerase